MNRDHPSQRRNESPLALLIFMYFCKQVIMCTQFQNFIPLIIITHKVQTSFHINEKFNIITVKVNVVESKISSHHIISMHNRHHHLPWGNPIRERTPTTFLLKLYYVRTSLHDYEYYISIKRDQVLIFSSFAGTTL